MHVSTQHKFQPAAQAAAWCCVAACLHCLARLYIRTGNMVMYRMIDLQKINWSKVPVWPRVRFIRLLPTANPGVADVTASLVVA
jgi:hypothetical protein